MSRVSPELLLAPGVPGFLVKTFRALDVLEDSLEQFLAPELFGVSVEQYLAPRVTGNVEKY